MQTAWAGLLLWEFFQVSVEGNLDNGERRPRQGQIPPLTALVLSHQSLAAALPELGAAALFLKAPGCPYRARRVQGRGEQRPR